MAAALLAGAAMFTSCSDDDDSKKDNVKTLSFESDYFAAFIDSKQYGGGLIYSKDDYVWADANTFLTSSCTKADWTQWGMGYGWDHGIAISNYVDADATASYTKQLSVPVSNGSKNFAIVWDNGSELKFADGKAHTIKSIDICPTTYCLNNIKANCGKDYNFTVTMTGKNGDNVVWEYKHELAVGTVVQDKWVKDEFDNYKAVTSVVFSFSGTHQSSYGGLATPKYVAFDNVVVEM